MLVSTGSDSKASYSGDKDVVEIFGVEAGGSGAEERIRFWACKITRCSLGCLTVTKRDVLDDELDCEETASGAGRAMRNPGFVREHLARGFSSVEEGHLDISGSGRKETGETIFGFVVAIFVISRSPVTSSTIRCTPRICYIPLILKLNWGREEKKPQGCLYLVFWARVDNLNRTTRLLLVVLFLIIVFRVATLTTSINAL